MRSSDKKVLRGYDGRKVFHVKARNEKDLLCQARVVVRTSKSHRRLVDYVYLWRCRRSRSHRNFLNSELYDIANN